MICQDIQDALVEVITQERLSDQVIEAHLAQCENCTQFAQETARIWRVLGQDQDVPLPLGRKLGIEGKLIQTAQKQANETKAPALNILQFKQRRSWNVVALAAMIALIFLFTLNQRNATELPVDQAKQKDESVTQKLWAELAEQGYLRDIELSENSNDPTVHLTLSVPKQVSVKGRPDEEPIQRVLTQTLTNPTSWSSTRERAILALKQSSQMSEQTRAIMIQVMISDPNPAVRLKAADALMGAVSFPDVLQAFLQVLTNDPNWGLRIRAIDAVLSVPVDQSEAIEVLRKVATTPESGPYEKIRAAEFLQTLQTTNVEPQIPSSPQNQKF